MSKHGCAVFCMVLVLLVAGCGNRNLIVLLPDPDGKVGELVVSNAEGTRRLNEANQGIAVDSVKKAPKVPKTIKQEKIDAVFGQAIAAQPLQPVRFILYFYTDSVRLTKDSRKLVPEIIEKIKERRSMDTSVVGHTDTVGTNNYNLRLAEARSVEVARMLRGLGVDPTTLTVTSHGENNPLIKTGDGVSELRNRRVEVTVR